METDELQKLTVQYIYKIEEAVYIAQRIWASYHYHKINIIIISDIQLRWYCVCMCICMYEKKCVECSLIKILLVKKDITCSWKII